MQNTLLSATTQPSASVPGSTHRASKRLVRRAIMREARARLQKLPAPSITELADYYMQTGCQYAREQQWDKAVFWLQCAASYKTADAQHSQVLAECCEQANRYPEAISAACVAINHLRRQQYQLQAATNGEQSTLQAQQTSLYCLIGRCCHHLNDLQGAKTAWRTALKQNPACREARLRLVATGCWE